VFSKQPRGNSFGPGHNTFVTSPDGTQDWIVYHAIDSSGGGWPRRSVRAQRFGWNADDTPDFGTPVSLGVAIAEPSGTPAPEMINADPKFAAARSTRRTRSSRSAVAASSLPSPVPGPSVPMFEISRPPRASL
jgi:hypothetical protein